MQTHQPNLFMTAMLIGTFDFHDFIQLSVTLTLAGDHKGSMKHNLLASFSCTYQYNFLYDVEAVQGEYAGPRFE